jgi:mRNA-degrading endonuclease RelE of RelBE toxin-antitoxin system
VNVTSRKSALKDVEKLSSEIKLLILSEIERLQNTASLGEMGNVIKLKGKRKPPKYRLSIDNYRIMMEKTEDGIIIDAIVSRKDAYMKKSSR